MKKATETLVKAAQQASVQVEEEAGAFGPAVSTFKSCTLSLQIHFFFFFFFFIVL